MAWLYSRFTFSISHCLPCISKNSIDFLFVLKFCCFSPVTAESPRNRVYRALVLLEKHLAFQRLARQGLFPKAVRFVISPFQRPLPLLTLLCNITLGYRIFKWCTRRLQIGDREILLYSYFCQKQGFSAARPVPKKFGYEL